MEIGWFRLSGLRALPPPEPSFVKLVGEGLSGDRPFGCLAVEVGLGQNHGVRQVHQPRRTSNLVYAEAGDLACANVRSISGE